MNSKMIAIAYCSDNQEVVNEITSSLQRVNYQIKPIPCQTSNGLKKAVEAENYPILLLISDNFLKSSDCMHESLAMIQILNTKKQFLPIITAGRYVENGQVNYQPTTFERVSNVIQYMNHWQDAYLAMRREKRHMNDQESATFEEKLKKVRTISSEVGEFLRYLRNTNYIDFENLKSNNYENVFRLVNDQTAFYEYKNLQPIAVSATPPKEKIEAVNGVANQSEEEVIVAASAPNSVMPLTKETPLESSIEITPEIPEVVADLPVIPAKEDLDVTPPADPETNVSEEETPSTPIPAGTLLMEDTVEEPAIGQPTSEPEEKGIEAGASNGVLAAFQEGMETTGIGASNRYNESQPEAEEDTLNDFDLSTIPGMEQLGMRANSKEQNPAQNIDNQPNTPSSSSNNIAPKLDTTLEDLMSDPAEETKDSSPVNHLNRIIEETVAEEEAEDLLEKIPEENIISIEDIFAEENTHVAPTPPVATPENSTIESLLSDVPTPVEPTSNIVNDTNIDLSVASDDEVLDDLMANAVDEPEELPTTLEQIVEETATATSEAIKSVKVNHENLEDVLAKDTPVPPTENEDEDEEEPLSWDDIINANPISVQPDEQGQEDEDNEEPIRWDELVAATEAQTSAEINQVVDIITPEPLPVEPVIPPEWFNLIATNATLGATLATLDTDFTIVETPIPLSPQTTIQRATMHFENGQLEDGLQLYKKQIAQRPNHSELRYQYALALMKEKNDFAESGQQLEYLLEKDTTHVSAYFTLAELAEMQGDALQAKMYYEKVAALDADYQDINYRLGIVNLTQPDDHNLEAAKHFKTAIKKNPQFADAYYQLALLLKNYAGKPDKAVKFFEKTLQVDARHPFAGYDLADTQQELGNHEVAAAIYAKAITINPDLQTAEKDSIYLLSKADTPDELLAAQAEIKRLEDLIATRAAEEQAIQGIAKMAATDTTVSNEAGKIVMITGATSGIGRATAELFARNGYRLVITGRRTERLAELETHFKESYNMAVQTLPFDVRDIEAVKKAIAELDDEWRQVDILINNAGLASGFAPIHEGDLEDWERMIDTNLKGLLYMTRAIAPHMVKRRSGHIINIGSIAGKFAYPNGNVYNATKFAVDGLTQAMRLDLYEHNIRVSQVAPGHVEETEFALVRFHGNEERAKIYEDFQPLTSHDVAETIYFIATRPPHVNVQDVLLMGTQQGGATFVDRSGRDKA